MKIVKMECNGCGQEKLICAKGLCFECYRRKKYFDEHGRYTKQFKQCQCCKKEIMNFGNKKFCSECALYIYKLKEELWHYKTEVKKLKLIVYGQKSGAERIRFKQPNKKREEVIYYT